jgi:sulfatase modifying factor 1
MKKCALLILSFPILISGCIHSLISKNDQPKIQKNKMIKILNEFENNMLYITGGTFLMGCTMAYNDSCDFDQKPVHSVTIDNFKLSKYEVTQSQWNYIMANNPSYFKRCKNCPVEQISWNDIQIFLLRLKELTGKMYRLPTEAEWEYAARGGNKSKGYLYSGGNNLNDILVYKKKVIKGDFKTFPIGQQKPNELGLYDMTGNAWEWCSDWYSDDYYSNSLSKNPKGPLNGESKVIRGGFSLFSKKGFGVAFREKETPDTKAYFLGFRLAAD